MDGSSNHVEVETAQKHIVFIAVPYGIVLIYSTERA